MMQPLKVTVRCLHSLAYPFEIFPEMTIAQFSEFVLNCQLLHQNTDGDDDFRRPVRLISTNGHHFIDFLLGNSDATLGQLFEVFRYVNMKEELSQLCLKQSEYEYHKNHGKVLPLALSVYYEGKDTLSTRSRRLYSYKIIQNDFKDISSRKSILDQRYLDIKSEIYFDSIKSELLVSRYILKSTLSSFSRVQDAYLMKKKLIQFHKDDFHIFGSLKHVRQRQDRIEYIFTYVPYVYFSEIMRFQFSNETISYLVNKIRMFLLTLIQNNYQGYIQKLFKRRQLRKLFDSIGFCFDNRLITNDLNLIFERGCDSERLTPSDHEQIIYQINIYIKLNKSQLRKYDERVQAYQASIHQISLFTFAKIYLKKQFQHFKHEDDDFCPKTNNFTWEKQHQTPQNQQKISINEVTTTKKVRNQNKDKLEKRIRKEQSRSLNRPRLHDSIKKTKCKKAYQ